MLLLIIIGSLSTGCNKVAIYDIRITEDPVSGKSIYERDTIEINYVVTTDGLDSVCLYINDDLMATQIIPEKIFHHIPPSPGSFKLKLVAFYESGISRTTAIFRLEVYDLIDPALRFAIKRDDGLNSYFIGEKLSITVEPKWDWMKISNFREVSLILNNINLGTRSQPQFTFVTGTITDADNQVQVVLRDSTNRVHFINSVMTVPVDSPPQLEFTFDYRHNMPIGYFLTSQPVILALKGSDNISVTHADFFLDGQFINSKTYNSNWFFGAACTIDNVSPGIHTVSCIGYDDRGLSTTTEQLSLTVYKDIDLTSEITDTDFSEENESVYISTNDKIYIINSISEEISEVIDLPYADAVSIDYKTEAGKLFIGFRHGRILVWNKTDKNLSEISSGLTNIENMLIQGDHAVTISNKTLTGLNLTTGKIFYGSGSHENKSSIMYDKVNNLIISGGNPGISSSHLYKHRLQEDSVIFISKKLMNYYIQCLATDPFHNEFIIVTNPGVYSTGYNSFSISDFSVTGKYEQYWPVTGTYTNTIKSVYVAVDQNIYDFSTVTHQKIKNWPIPVGDRMNRIISNYNDSRIVLITDNASGRNRKLIIIRT